MRRRTRKRLSSLLVVTVTVLLVLSPGLQGIAMPQEMDSYLAGDIPASSDHTGEPAGSEGPGQQAGTGDPETPDTGETDKPEAVDPDDPGNVPSPEGPDPEPGDPPDPGSDDPAQPEDPSGPVEPGESGEPTEPKDPEAPDAEDLDELEAVDPDDPGNVPSPEGPDPEPGDPPDPGSDDPAQPEDPSGPGTPPQGPGDLEPPVDPNPPPGEVVPLEIPPELPSAPAAEPEVEVTISADQVPYAPGDTVTFAIQVTNTGNVDLSALIVEDTLTGLNETIAHLAAGDEWTGSSNFVIPEDFAQDKLTNSLYVQGQYEDQDVSAQAATVVEVLLAPTVPASLAVDIQTDKEQYRVGDTVHLTITISNQGMADLSDIRLWVPLADFNEKVAFLASGEEVVLEAGFDIPCTFDMGSLLIGVYAEGDWMGSAVNSQGQVSVMVVGQLIEPLLEVKLQTDKDRYQPGETVYYTVTVTNIGNIDIENVVAHVKSSLGSVEESVGLLIGGEEKTFAGEFQLNPDYEDTKFEIRVDVSGYWTGFGTGLQDDHMRSRQMASTLSQEPGTLVVASDLVMLMVDSGPKLYEYGDPLPDNGGTASPSQPSEPRTLPPIPKGGEYTDTVEVDKTAKRVVGCRAYQVTLNISGDSTVSKVRPIDLVVLIDVSGSMDEGSPSVWTKGKEHAVTFAQNIASRAESEVAIVTFAHNMNKQGEGSPDRNEVGLTNNDTYVKQDFTRQKGHINSGINNINVYSSGSNIEAGLKKALGVVDRSGRPHTHKIIVLFTDGLANVSNGVLPGPDWPTHHNTHTAAAIAAGQAAWSTARVYSVGLFKEIPSESASVAEETLDWASNAGFYQAVSETDMERILDEIFTQIVPIATDAVVTDKIPTDFDLVEGSISGSGVYDEVTRTITWNLGTVSAETELTYKIKATSSNPGGNQMPTNEWAKLHYTNVNGNPAVIEFPIPEVYVPGPLTVDAGLDRQVPLGSSTVLGGDPTATGGTESYDYKWTSSTDPTWSSTSANPQVTPAEDTIYFVTVTDQWGCSKSDSVKVTILKGAITVTKVVANGSSSKKFPIYVEGNGQTWSMLLSDGESATIQGLEPGTYTIREVVPMNYKLESISPSQVIFTEENISVPQSVTVTNRKVNDSWFWDEDEEINTFRVGFWSEPEGEPQPQGDEGVLPTSLEAVLSPEGREDLLEESEAPDDM